MRFISADSNSTEYSTECRIYYKMNAILKKSGREEKGKIYSHP